jgi:Cof subfamily protein (haloacid dehalogenase superfamily)
VVTFELIALDIDGTLLDDSGRVSAANHRAVRAAVAAGVAVVLVTGRAAADVPPELPAALNLHLPFVASHGAETIEPRSRRRLRHVPLEAPHARDVIEHAQREGLPAAAYFAGRYRCLAGAPPAAAHSCGEPWEVVESLLEHESYETPTFLRLFGKAAIASTCERFGTLPLLFKHEPWSDFDECAITHADATKHAALQRLCADLNVDRERVLAIGDSRNDLPMLRWAGTGIAMGNAPADVRAGADDVTTSVEHDGVARAIERYVFAGSDERSA